MYGRPSSRYVRYQPNTPSRGFWLTPALYSSVIRTVCTRGARMARRTCSISATSAGASPGRSSRPSGGGRRTHSDLPIIHASTMTGIPSLNATYAPTLFRMIHTDPAMSAASTTSAAKRYAYPSTASPATRARYMRGCVRAYSVRRATSAS